MFNRHLIYGSWRERYCNLPVDTETSPLYIMSMCAYATLAGECDGHRMWIVRHDIALPVVDPKQLAWRELTLPEDTTFKVITGECLNITDHFVFMRCTTSIIDEFDGGDQYSSKEGCVYITIIVWGVRDISRTIPCHILYNEATDDAHHPVPVYTRCYTKVASDSHLSDESLRYSILDLKRKSCYLFGPIYNARYAYIQTFTDDYVQIIILYHNSNDMMVKHEGSVKADNKPVGLCIHWHSYIFDDEHDVSLEDLDDEIIIPYYYDKHLVVGERYGPSLSIITICNWAALGNSEDSSDDEKPYAVLALVRVPDHSLSRNSISYHRRSRYDGAIGEIIWAQPIATLCVSPLYSQNLIMVKDDSKIDIISGTDGKIVRQFDCAVYEVLRPIIGLYCHLLGYNCDNFIINIETEETFRHSTKLLSLEKRRTVAPAEDGHGPSSPGQSSRLPFTPHSWPFCNCIGQLIIHEPGHQNGFYLYSLSAFWLIILSFCDVYTCHHEKTNNANTNESNIIILNNLVSN
jgi:hypothetical protein